MLRSDLLRSRHVCLRAKVCPQGRLLTWEEPASQTVVVVLAAWLAASSSEGHFFLHHNNTSAAGLYLTLSRVAFCLHHW